MFKLPFKDKISLYKFKLYAVQFLCFLTVCFALFLLFGNYGEHSTDMAEQKSSTNQEMQDEGNEIKTEDSDDISIPDDQPSDIDVPSNYDLPKLQDKISEIMEAIDIEPYLAKHVDDTDNESSIDNSDNVKIVEEKYIEPKKDIRALIAIVIDDMGISQSGTRGIINIDGKLTASFLTYGQNLQEFIQEAKENGKEVIVHIPMEPSVEANTAPDQLNVAMSDKEIKTGLITILNHFDKGLIGGNNHMGSKFTENKEKMSVVMKILHKRNMFFLDSKTSPKAVGCEVAKKYNVDCINRDVFLDNENDFDYITKQLKQTERIADKRGYAVAIGHPKTQTIAALKKWVESLDKTKYKLVYLSEVIKKIKNK